MKIRSGFVSNSSSSSFVISLPKDISDFTETEFVNLFSTVAPLDKFTERAEYIREDLESCDKTEQDLYKQIFFDLVRKTCVPDDFDKDDFGGFKEHDCFVEYGNEIGTSNNYYFDSALEDYLQEVAYIDNSIIHVSYQSHH